MSCFILHRYRWRNSPMQITQMKIDLIVLNEFSFLFKNNEDYLFFKRAKTKHKLTIPPSIYRVQNYKVAWIQCWLGEKIIIIKIFSWICRALQNVWIDAELCPGGVAELKKKPRGRRSCETTSWFENGFHTSLYFRVRGSALMFLKYISLFNISARVTQRI
jgi:hypothetical protein